MDSKERLEKGSESLPRLIVHKGTFNDHRGIHIQGEKTAFQIHAIFPFVAEKLKVKIKILEGRIKRIKDRFFRVQANSARMLDLIEISKMLHDHEEAYGGKITRP